MPRFWPISERVGNAARIRPAGAADARDIAGLVSTLVRGGDTSAIAGPVARADIIEWMDFAPERSAWHVAETDSGDILGVQWIEPHHDLPPDTADIATLVVQGRQRIGIGSSLFAQSLRAGRRLGYRWLHAYIRADNEGGLIYYRSRGFEPWRSDPEVPLADGRRIDRVAMRYDLR